MPRERVPEHPDDVRRWRQDVLGFVYGFSAIGLAIGALLTVLAFSAQSWWSDPTRPANVEYAIWSGYRVGGVLIGLCLSVMVVTWYWSKRIEAAKET